VTRHRVGAGVAWYVSTRLHGEHLDAVLNRAYADAGLSARRDLPAGLELVRRGRHLVAINHTRADAEIPGTGTELLTDTPCTGRLVVPALDVRVLRTEYPAPGPPALTVPTERPSPAPSHPCAERDEPRKALPAPSSHRCPMHDTSASSVGWVSPLLSVLVVAVVVAVVLVGLWRLAARARRRGIAAPVMSVFDEVFHPVADESRRELRGQEERSAPRPSSGAEPDGNGGLRL
jgi:hypothetical protein